MTQQTDRSSLADIAAFEAAAFRASQVARQLLADHPDLPCEGIRLHASAARWSGSETARVEISAPDTDAVRAWAEVFGAQVQVKTIAASSYGPAFDHHQVVCEVTGVEVQVWASWYPPAEEAAARHHHEQSGQGAAAPTGAGR